jgi:MFS family permease
MGIPVGMMVDAKGPRPAVIMGALLLGAGYFPLHQAYDKGSGSMPLLCIFSFFTGLGGCAAFAAAIKTSALNWPYHRGTATAFPLAAFGLSAFFFSMFAQFVMPGNTGHFLFLLACGTFGIVFISFFFLQVLPHPHYSAVPTYPGLSRVDSNPLRRTKSEESKRRAQQALEPGRSSSFVAHLDEGDILNQQDIGAEAPEIGAMSETDETSSLMSKSSSSGPGDVIEESNIKDHSHRVDIRGIKMLPMLEFWQLFALMGILTGIGLMTIK